MSNLPPLIFDSSGPVATPPAILQEQLINLVTADVPGYTAALPASLIEDVSSTDVGALTIVDQARVDAVNNVSPYSANPYVLLLQGYQFGIPQATLTNGSADVVFTGTPGFTIPAGWIVGDGTNQYLVQAPGSIVGSGGSTPQTTVVCTNSNVFAIPANSITTLITQPPTGVSLSVTNPQAGVPAAAQETTEAYRSRILTAYQQTASGVNTMLKTLLLAVSGVSPRLVSVLQQGIYWEVICGGGDVYEVAYAIYQGVSNIGLLTGSTIDTGRDVQVSIYDAPDTYNVIFVNPPQQVVTVAVTWNTTLPNFTSGAAVNQYIIPAVQAYINSIVVGQPINLLVLNESVQSAVVPVLATSNLTTLEFVITINGVVHNPTAGTWIIPSDPESYFQVSSTGVTSVQG